MNRILLLIEQQKNRHLLSQWLAERYQVLSPETDSDLGSQGDNLLSQSFDLCFVDFAAVRKLKQPMLAKREAETPVFLPFVFLTNQENIGISTDHLETLIDDVVHIPISKIELQTRLRVLLRSRSYSLQLREAKERVDLALSQEKELNRLKSHFVSVVSHEFRNPLNSILGMAQILENYGDKLSPDKKGQILEQLRRNVLKMNDLLDDVLIVSRKDLGKLNFAPTAVELPVFCQNLVEEIATTFGKKPQIDFVFQGEPQQFSLDPKLLEHILANLLSNACKYSPQDSTVEFRVCCQESKAVFIVSDRGIGIPDRDLAELFTPFYRASNSKEIQGTGLGLTIVKQCVDLHQGEVTVESQLGKGTTFTVSIPVKDRS